MTSRFWFLDPPRPQGLAEEARDTDYGQIVCPADADHRRAGKRIGALSVIVHPLRVGDFTFSWMSDILVSQRVLDLFEKYHVSGFKAERVKTSYPKTIKGRPPDLFELVVTGWGGFAAPAAGVKLAESCPGCGYKEYTIAEPSRLIDAAAWDGSDLFIVWPLPGYRFVSDRLADIIRQEKFSGVKVVPATQLPTERGAGLSPGPLSWHMPEARARELERLFEFRDGLLRDAP
jgi:hypothetical protein